MHIVVGNAEQSTRHILPSFSLPGCVAVRPVQKFWRKRECWADLRVSNEREPGTVSSVSPWCLHQSASAQKPCRKKPAFQQQAIPKLVLSSHVGRKWHCRRHKAFIFPPYWQCLLPVAFHFGSKLYPMHHTFLCLLVNWKNTGEGGWVGTLALFEDEAITHTPLSIPRCTAGQDHGGMSKLGRAVQGGACLGEDAVAELAGTLQGHDGNEKCGPDLILFPHKCPEQSLQLVQTERLV